MRPLLILALYKYFLFQLVSASETPSRSPSFPFDRLITGYASENSNDNEEDDEIFIPNSARAREALITSVISNNKKAFEHDDVLVKFKEEEGQGKEDVKDGSDAQELEEKSLQTVENEEGKEVQAGTPLKGELTPSSTTFASSSESVEDNVNSNELSAIAPLFPHVVGIKNHALNCYASALISCLYNIPLFHATLFETLQNNLEKSEIMSKTESITAAIATILYKMRTGRSTVALDTFFASALKKSTGWEFGELECVLDFWGQVSEILPKEISNLFKVEFKENHYRKADDLLIKSVPQESNMILVAPSHRFRNIEEFLANNFIDEDAEDFFIEPKYQNEYPHILQGPIEEKVKISSKTTLTISNYPKILIFGVKRLDWNDQTKTVEFNFLPLGFPETLTIEGEEYSIVGNIEYDQRRVHYFARNLDLLDDQWYVHDDRHVQMVPDTILAFNTMSYSVAHTSCMIFYVKKSSLEEFRTDQNKLEVPIEVVNRLNSRLKFKKPFEKVDNSESNFDAGKEENPEIKSDATQISPVFKEPKTVVRKQKRPSLQVQNSDEKVIKKAKVSLTSRKKHIKPLRQLGNSIKKTIQILDSSFMDLQLGTLPFLFKGTCRNLVLESFLMALSRNPAVVRILFETAKDKPRDDIQFKFALTILKMLVGRMDIDTSQLSDELVQEYQIDFNNFYRAWLKIGQLLPEEISPFPDIKLIKYNLDEPLNIANFPNCPHEVSIKPRRTIPTRHGMVFNGPFADHVEDESDPSQEHDFYTRCLFKSSGMILPMQVARTRPGEVGYFDNKRIEFNDGGYIAYGSIGILPLEKKFFAFFLDFKSPDKAYILERGVPRPVTLDNAMSTQIASLFRHYSSLIFMTKPQDFKMQLPMMSEVPKVFIDEMNSQLNY